MRAADETYVLVDSSKYGHDCLTSFARLRDVDLTITDSHLSRSKAAILEAAGARLCIVDVAKANLDREAARLNLKTEVWAGKKASFCPKRL
jgi:cysteine synthase